MLVDKFWAEALSDVLRKGEERIDRTGVGTISRFGSISGSTSVNCGNQIPIITLKKVHFKSVLAELIFFIKGKTNVDFLHKYNCTIWDGWMQPDGELGPIYGKIWRDFNGIDQLANVIESIKNDPFGRRHVVTAWKVDELDKMALPPCHMFFQFYVSKHGYLDIFFYMRSCDLFLGFPFNVTSYALLLMIVAKLTGYTAGNVHWHLGDAHIYKNHIDQVKIALGRTMVSPQNAQIVFADKVYNSIDDFEVEDIELINYQSHPVIKAPIAI